MHPCSKNKGLDQLCTADTADQCSAYGFAYAKIICDIHNTEGVMGDFEH